MKCEQCHGSGWNAATDLRCARCNGRGRTRTGDVTTVQVVTVVLALALFAVMLAQG